MRMLDVVLGRRRIDFSVTNPEAVSTALTILPFEEEGKIHERRSTACCSYDVGVLIIQQAMQGWDIAPAESSLPAPRLVNMWGLGDEKLSSVLFAVLC